MTLNKRCLAINLLGISFSLLSSNAFSPGPFLSLRRSITDEVITVTQQYSHVQNNINSNRHPHITNLMMVRGGGASSSDEESYSDSEMEESKGEENNEEPSKPETKDMEITQRQLSLSQQSRNLGIATALWSSLFFDSILNKAKRQYLFPVAATGEASIAVNLVPTALLASGFALASCVSFLLWRDADVRSEMSDESDIGEDIMKGDWFLSLSCLGGETDKQFASQTRKRLYFHLVIFGLFNLAASASYFFSEEAPFLGLSALAINVHNTLAVANSLLIESSASELVLQAVRWPLTLFSKGDENTQNKSDTLAFFFQLSAVTFWVRCIPVCRAIVSIAGGLLSRADPTPKSLINNSRQLSLGIAALGRLTLAAGVSQVLFSSKAHTISDRMRRHPFFAALSGMSSLLCFGVAGSLLLPALSSGLQVSTLISKSFPFDGALLSLMGVYLGYNSMLGIIESMKQLRK